MPNLTPDAIRKWVKGARADAVEEGDLEQNNPGDPQEAQEVEELNPLWSGEDPRPEEQLAMMDEEEAEEFHAWLGENEPDIYQAVSALSAAVDAGDVAAIEQAKQQLMAAEQYLVPEYPEFDQAQREAVAAQLAAHQGEGPTGVAIAIVAARKPAEEEEVEEGEEELFPQKPKPKPGMKPGMKPPGMKPKPGMVPGRPAAPGMAPRPKPKAPGMKPPMAGGRMPR
jgi:hypothetical protein